MSTERLNNQTDDTDKVIKALNVRVETLQNELVDARRCLDR